MLSSSQIKLKTQELLKPLAEIISSIGVSPNTVTVAGFFFSLISGFLIATDNLGLGTVFFVFSGICDMMDGIIARVTEKTSPFGAFLDSFLDRYADFFPLCGFVVLGFNEDNLPLVLFSLFSMVGAFATSYARARAESLGADCRFGIVERPERFFILLFALVTGFFIFSLFVLAVLSNATAFQRLLCAAEKLER
jgi:phosphatidylglycerophosphate synthase